MSHSIGFKPAVKMALFWIVFMCLYFAYKLFPFFPLSLISSVNESNFQHYKSTFFAFLILNLIEYLLFRRQIKNLSSFLGSRGLATILAPWVVFLLWYVGPAVYGQMPSIPLEILYANGITLLVGFCVAILETGFAHIPFTRPMLAVMVALFLISLLLYFRFTFELPWADVFVEPHWR